MKQMQERLTHEEESVEALRGDSRMKEETIKKLKRSMKEVRDRERKRERFSLQIREIEPSEQGQ